MFSHNFWYCEMEHKHDVKQNTIALIAAASFYVRHSERKR
jgi:hypothetical protein